MASMIAKRNPELFSYFILISSYKPRCLKYVQLLSASSEPLKCSSLHIYGQSDRQVTPDRSRALALCFEKSQSVAHAFGHFAPDVWPLKEICDFVAKSAGTSKKPHFSKADGLEANIVAFNVAITRFKLQDLDLNSLFESQSNLLKSNEFESFFIEKDVTVFDEVVFNDKVLAAYFLMNIAEGNHDESDHSLVANLWLRIYNQHRDMFLSESILDKCFLIGSHWKELIHLCDVAFQSNVTDLYREIVEMLTGQVVSDVSAFDKRCDKHVLVEWTSSEKPERVVNEPSDLAMYLPRIKNAIDKRSRIGREIACRLNDYRVATDPDKLKYLKVESYNK